MERLRGYAIIIMVGVLTGLGFLVEGCGGGTDPYGRGSMAIVCKPGERVLVGLYAQPGLKLELLDTITETTRYDGLRTGTWRLQLGLPDSMYIFKARTIGLAADKTDTFSIYEW